MRSAGWAADGLEASAVLSLPSLRRGYFVVVHLETRNRIPATFQDHFRPVCVPAGRRRLPHLTPSLDFLVVRSAVLFVIVGSDLSVPQIHLFLELRPVALVENVGFEVQLERGTFQEV